MPSFQSQHAALLSQSQPGSLMSPRQLLAQGHVASAAPGFSPPAGPLADQLSSWNSFHSPLVPQHAMPTDFVPSSGAQQPILTDIGGQPEAQEVLHAL